MPLLCISLLVLVLLPFSLSCDSKKSLTEVQEKFRVFVQVHMDNTRDNITGELKNASCLELKHKPPSCSTNRADIVETFLLQACEMLNLKLQQTNELADVVQTSIDCPCPRKTTKDPSLRSPRKRIARNKEERHMKKLCKANAILSSMTLCYQKLNDLLDI